MQDLPDPGPKAGKSWFTLGILRPKPRAIPYGYAEGVIYSQEYLERREGPAPHPFHWRYFNVPLG